jgi:uncharacterized repeat protein (TIGR01451 family)
MEVDMTQLHTDINLRCGLFEIDRAHHDGVSRSWTRTAVLVRNWAVRLVRNWTVRLVVTALTVLMAFAASSASAQVRLENTIKKVETFVNSAGTVERRLVDAMSVVPGDELQYTVHFVNNGTQPVDAGTIVITDAIPAHTEYLDGTAFGSGTQVWFSVDGEMFASPADLSLVKDGVEVNASASQYRSIRWNFGPALQPGASSYVSFNVRLK